METMSLEIKSNLDVKASIDLAPDGSFSGYASTYDLDAYGDRVVAGAFRNDLRERGGRRPLLYQHNQEKPIGYVDLLEDSKGLRVVRGQLVLDLEIARDARALIKSGSIDGLSIGYQTVRDRRAKDGARELLEVRLFEVSLVTVLANPKATISAVKSSAFAEFLEQLRDAKRSLKASAADRATRRAAEALVADMRAFKRTIRDRR